MNRAQHWSRQNERGSAFFLALTCLLVRRLPLPLMRLVVRIVVTYFYLTSPKQRQHLRCYHQYLQQTFPQTVLPKFAVWRQFAAFGDAVSDRFAVWQHKIRYSHLAVHDPDDVYGEIRRGGRGQIFVCSHFGNVEICRALVSHHQGFRLNVLMHSAHAVKFNRALAAAGADEIHLIQVADLDAALMLELNRRLDEGEWIAIAADRTPIRGEKTVVAEFLGRAAAFPQGPWLLAMLLKAPVNLLFCVWHGGQYHLYLNRFLDDTPWRRSERAQKVRKTVQAYADRLAQMCAQYPLQWFNFYDFWKDDGRG